MSEILRTSDARNIIYYDKLYVVFVKCLQARVIMRNTTLCKQQRPLLGHCRARQPYCTVRVFVSSKRKQNSTTDQTKLLFRTLYNLPHTRARTPHTFQQDFRLPYGANQSYELFQSGSSVWITGCDNRELLIRTVAITITISPTRKQIWKRKLKQFWFD
jgi:hypothetical protein